MSPSFVRPEARVSVMPDSSTRIGWLIHRASVIPWFPYVLSVAVFLFAFSTMISWSYYGERCWVWLFGDRSSIIYKLLFLISCFLGSIITATNILDFSDLMILGMAVPNILGMLFLSRVARNELRDYEQKLSK